MIRKQDMYDIAEFTALLAKECPDVPSWVLNQAIIDLIHLNAALHRSYENGCNYELTARQEKRQARLEQRVLDILSSIGLKGILHGDPRGIPIHIYLPSGRSNGFGGKEDGWCVPLIK